MDQQFPVGGRGLETRDLQVGGATRQVVLFLRALRSSPAGWPRTGTVDPIDAVTDLNHTGRKPLAALPGEQSGWQVWWRKNGVCKGQPERQEPRSPL